ncbi:hypothetical protein DFH09DRAFT_1087475 [Mycena vulgaris]|nr:hypothetical protein DFH09DRAFT_1087475 [Mycena vulgaris]
MIHSARYWVLALALLELPALVPVLPELSSATEYLVRRYWGYPTSISWAILPSNLVFPDVDLRFSGDSCPLLRSRQQPRGKVDAVLEARDTQLARVWYYVNGVSRSRTTCS